MYVSIISFVTSIHQFNKIIITSNFVKKIFLDWWKWIDVTNKINIKVGKKVGRIFCQNRLPLRFLNVRKVLLYLFCEQKCQETLSDWVSYDHSLIWPRDIWPRTFDHFKILWHLTTVTFDRRTFDRKWHLTAGHLTASDIWPRDIWPQWHLTAGHLTTVTFDRGTFDRGTFDHGTFDRSDIWPRDFGPATKIRKTWPQVTFDRGTFDRQWRLTAGRLTAVTFDRGIFDQQPRLEKLDHKWHLTVGPLTASDVWPRDVWPQWHLTTGFLTSNQD